MKKIIGAVLVLLGIGTGALVWKMHTDMPKAQEQLAAAAFLSEPAVLLENEGRLVVCSGTLEMTAPAVDGELNVTLPSPKVERLTERYENAGTAGKPKYEWRKIYSGALGSRKLVGEARLGTFVLAPELLETLPTPAFCQEFDGEELARAGLEMYSKLLGNERYLSRSKGDVRGALRFSYRVSNLGGRQVTVKAIQKDGALHPAPDQAPCVLEGILSREEVLKDSEESGVMGLATGAVIAALLLAAGVVAFCRG